VRGGVPASSVVLPSIPCTSGLTVLDGLAQRLPAVDRAQWQARLHAGEVLDEDGQPVAAHTSYRNGMRLHYWRSLPHEAPVPFAHRVLHADAQLVVADKPHFLPVTPGGRHVEHTLLVRLQRELGLPGLSPIHRIDRETAGLVAFAVRPQTRDAYQRLFRERQVTKFYEALAPLPNAPMTWPHTRRSRLEQDPGAFFRMHEVTGEANSQTQVELLRAVDGSTGLYRLHPVTGKRHQLRVHMAALGLPLVGDAFYPRVRWGPDEADNFSNPLQLLARTLAFTDPITGQERRFDSQLALQHTTG
jgi:tRNA pseudouridine32 synthase / 23S rRNA pseudouridine746 synthase